MVKLKQLVVKKKTKLKQNSNKNRSQIDLNNMKKCVKFAGLPIFAEHAHEILKNKNL